MSYTPNIGTYDDRLEAVIVCVDYGDILAETLPYTRSQFDRIVVVTALDDLVTRQVCAKASVRVASLPDIRENGFNRSKAVIRGMMELTKRGWVVNLDADIVVPIDLRNNLWKSALDRDCIYGCTRYDVIGREAWESIKPTWNQPSFEQDWFVNPPSGIKASPQVVHRDFGWIPIGFFQAWHSSYVDRYALRYTSASGDGSGDDAAWPLNWAASNRRLLPMVNVLHLQSEFSTMGANWRGRTTKQF